MQASSGKIGWKVAKLSLNVASVRYRALLPVLALQAAGKSCQVFADYNNCNLDGISLLVIVKGLIPNDLELAREAHQRGIPIVLDLCDCIFVENYGGVNYSVQPAKTFLAIAELASAVVVPTEPLADVVRGQVNNRIPVFVIPDGIDSSELQSRAQQVVQDSITHARNREGAQIVQPLLRKRTAEPQYTGWKKIRKKLSRKYKKLLTAIRNEGFGTIAKKQRAKCLKVIGKLLRLQVFPTTAASAAQAILQAETQPSQSSLNCNAKRIMWFGNHGAPYAQFGMLDLLEIKESLELMASELDVKLVVISDNYEKYEQHIKPLKIKSEYIAWNPTVVEQEFARASVVVIPNPLETFSICKSANRAVLALKHGVPVVATETPALRPLASCMVFDDFERGLRTYLTDSQKAKVDVELGQQLIEILYGQSQTLGAWTRVISQTISGSQAAKQAA